MAVIYIENKPYEVNPEENLLHQCLSLGFNLPYFCWHPALGSVGACRQCAVKQFRDDKDAHGKIVMACMTPAADGTRISIEDPEARAFRASVIEWLMLNHPHDCPVCDEGGECHLQDMTVMTGHDYRHTRFRKRTHRNQYLGPFLNHEMNRCIQCYRCVRYYRDYAGGRDLDVFAAHDHVYFGRHSDGILENEFSGNLVEVCPTGVFTDKTLKRHYTRKWDLQMAPSICIHCSLGCNISAGERYGTLRRILNRYNGQVNGYFICDRGRFGYEYVNSERRILRPLLRQQESRAQMPASKADALDWLARKLGPGARMIGIGSPRASLEANFALRKLVGPSRFYSGMPRRQSDLVQEALRVMRRFPAPPATLHDAEASDAVLILGEDVTNVAPRLALAVRQAARQQPLQAADKMKIARWHDSAVRDLLQDTLGPVAIAFPSATRLDDVAALSYRAAPQDLARLGFAIAHAANASAPEVPDLDQKMLELATRIAGMLMNAAKPLVVAGTSLGTRELMLAAEAVAFALSREGGSRRTGLALVFPECNTLGLGLLEAGSLDDALEAVEQGSADSVIILENDLYRRADSNRIASLLRGGKNVVAIDSVSNATNSSVDLVLPCSTFAEGDGTFVNNEGRAQRFFRVLAPEGDVQESWRWLRDCMITTGSLSKDSWQGLDEVISEMCTTLPSLRPVAGAAPEASYREKDQRIPRAPLRYSGRTAMLANVTVHEPAPPGDPDSPLAFSMEGYAGHPPPPLIPFFWSPGWNSIQSVKKFQEEVNGPLRGGDPGVRLIEPRPEDNPSTPGKVPGSFFRREGAWYLLPASHIFGSEELSAMAPGISERAPKPYLALSAADGKTLGSSEGEIVEVVAGEWSVRLPLTLDPSIPVGVALLPLGLDGLEWIDLPTWAEVKRGDGTRR